MRWRRARQFTCLVAVDQDTGAVVGTAQVAMMQPEALFPPPFPTRAPFRPYIANMAVVKAHRRRGVARGLLRACVRLGRCTSLLNNQQASMYKHMQYAICFISSSFTGSRSEGFGFSLLSACFILWVAGCLGCV